MMFGVSKRVRQIRASERSQRAVLFPEGTVRLDMGEPDFSTPLHIQEAATKAMRDNWTHYSNPYGDEQLREAICMSLERDYGVQRNLDDVLVTAGGIEAIHVISATYLDPGDQALILDPDYSAFAESVSLFGGEPVFVPRTHRFHLDLQAVEDRVTPRAKLIFLSNPGNPTATVLSREELKGLAELAIRHNLLLVIDEVYDKLIYSDTDYFSIGQLEGVWGQAILLNSFSKTYAMTGWRVGYLVAEASIIKDLVAFHKATITCANVPAQKACVAALTGPQECVATMRATYDDRRSFMEEALGTIDRLYVLPCEGAFYFFPRFEYPMTSKEMASYLASKGILIRSGTEFGANGESHFRVTFATSKELLEQGMERLEKALDELD